MNNFRRNIPNNTNRHAFILTHSLSRFTLPRCALHSDNPGLWDIRLSSRDFCETIAKAMSLIKLVSEHHTNYAKIFSAPDFRSPCCSDQRRFRQASGHPPRTSDQATGYSCDQHRACVRCTLYCCDKRPLTRQTERFSIA